MKKIALYIFAAVCCLSCELRGGNAEYYLGSKSLTDYAWNTMESSLGEANKTFGILLCADKYLSYTGEDRDLQWFSNYVTATDNNGVIKITAAGREMPATTNGLGFNDTGAIFEVNGFIFTCTSEGTWTVENEKMDSEVEVLASGAMGLTYEWEGHGSDKDKSGDVKADYDFNITFNWGYKSNPSWNSFNANSVIKGFFNFSISRNGKETDWVKCKILNTETKITTSRD